MVNGQLLAECAELAAGECRHRGSVSAGADKNQPHPGRATELSPDAHSSPRYAGCTQADVVGTNLLKVDIGNRPEIADIAERR